MMSKIRRVIIFSLIAFSFLVIFFWNYNSFENYYDPLSVFEANNGFETPLASSCIDFDRCLDRILFIKTDKNLTPNPNGQVRIIIFDPKAPNLDFQVNLPLKGYLGETNSKGKLTTEYEPKKFNQLINDQNSLLKNQLPIAGINADYIDEENIPQGLNISRGLDYSGYFSQKRSSFGISKDKIPSIQIGKRKDPKDNFNIVGGNGSFYKSQKFIDICENIGPDACNQKYNRSMAVITTKNYVLFVNYQSVVENFLPSEFDPFFQKICEQMNLGKPQDGILFDGGSSPGIFFRDEIFESSGNIGSVFLIYDLS